MPSNFPTQLDAVVDGDLIEAEHLNSLQEKVGIDGSLDTNSLDYKLTNAASVDPGHKHSIGAINGLQAALDAKVTGNASITPGTKTKITFDAKGLVTGGADATTSDIAEGSNLYYTSARFDAALATKSTSDLAEGSNLYFTNSRAISALTGQNISIFTNNAGYLTANQTITLSGDVSGTGSTSITTTLATVNSNVGSFTFANITVDAKGRITAASSGSPGTITSVSGTADRISSTGGTTPVIDIASTYVGQASITTLGTITTGVWTGTTIALANGGTGTTTGLRFNNLIAANGTNAINNAASLQEWQWNTLAGTSGLKLSSTSTAAASNAQKLFESALSGTNSNSAQKTYAGYFTNTHTGTTSTNVAGYFQASGGAANFALIAAYDENNFIEQHFTLEANGIPAYANTGGTGDRTSLITVIDGVGFQEGTGSLLVNGVTSGGGQQVYLGNKAVAGLFFTFDFNSTKLITEIRYYQGGAISLGNWRVQGSQNNSNWTNIGNTFQLGGSGPSLQTITELSGNTTAYRYYRFLGVSGTAGGTGGAYLYEFEFKIASSVGAHAKFQTYITDGATAGGNLVLQNAGGNVGIVEDSPASTLAVRGNLAVGSTQAYSAFVAPTGGAIIEGTVGIGTFSPSTKLHIVSTANSGLTLTGNSLTTGNLATITSSSVSSGALLNLSSNSTAAASNTQKGLNIAISGANGTSTQTTYGSFVTNTHTGTSSTNVAGYFSASGGTSNYGLIVAAGTVGIGTTTPTATTHIVQAVVSTGSPTALLVVGGAHTTLTASTEATDLNLNFARTVQWATGALTTQRTVRIQAQTVAFVGASTLTDGVTFEVSGGPIAGTNATITRSWAARFLGNTAISTGLYIGASNVAPTAYLHLAAGKASASTAPFKMTSGTNNTTAEAGAMEYDGTNLFFTRTGTTRESVLVGNAGATAPSTSIGAAIVNYYGSSATNFLGDPNSWAGVNIGGVAYKIPLYS